MGRINSNVFTKESRQTRPGKKGNRLHSGKHARKYRALKKIMVDKRKNLNRRITDLQTRIDSLEKAGRLDEQVPRSRFSYRLTLGTSLKKLKEDLESLGVQLKGLGKEN
ncbi:MAG: hypothetical protein JW744_05225 [Candidatus Diapherotrites archaeon]|uniref:Uncharacterized protein n=1 Tax=Candidatus Iainarchaeum sp. TaxID=3101447 RepID=A0A938YYT7_9ARCH|nr:hypothetical protein [Candidatus Diapherotrites archaeon]